MNAPFAIKIPRWIFNIKIEINFNVKLFAFKSTLYCVVNVSLESVLRQLRHLPYKIKVIENRHRESGSGFSMIFLAIKCDFHLRFDNAHNCMPKMLSYWVVAGCWCVVVCFHPLLNDEEATIKKKLAECDARAERPASVIYCLIILRKNKAK